MIIYFYRSPGYFKNDLIDILTFMEEIQVKEDADKSRFFSSLSGQLDSCPDIVARGKILPQLIIAFEFGNAGSSILAPVFKIGKTLESKVRYQHFWLKVNLSLIPKIKIFLPFLLFKGGGCNRTRP